MSKSNSYQKDRSKARAAAYRYANNPFEEGTRLARLYDKEKLSKSRMDVIFDDMQLVYGTIGTQKPIINNAVGSFDPL